MSDTKYGMPIETEDDRGMPEKSIILHTCSRIADNLAAGRPVFDGCDDAGLTELVSQIQVEQLERDPDWPSALDLAKAVADGKVELDPDLSNNALARPDLDGFQKALRKACKTDGSPF